MLGSILMMLQLAKRLLLETDKRLLWKLAWNMGLKGDALRPAAQAPAQARRVLPAVPLRLDHQHLQPPLPGLLGRRRRTSSRSIQPDAFHKLVREAKAMGNVFFGIVGGEPFMHPHLLDMLAEHPDCYFQIFTNGHFITDEKAKRMRQLGNVTPLISVEGTEIVSDERRGRAGVLSKTMQGLQNCLNNKVFTGVCTSLCRTNIDDLLTEKWVDRLIEMGVMYTWFHVYRPMGPDPNPDLCLTPEQQLRARKFVVEMRAKKPIIIIDAYYDGEGQALCPAATGISHHINPWGDIEPCPIVQFSKESIHANGGDTRSLRREVPAVGVPARLPRAGRSRRRAAASCWSGRTC